MEFVESTQPPLGRDKKEVLIVSTLEGCPVQCAFCDAGGMYRRKLTASEISEQIDYIVQRRYGDGPVATEKFKIQFSRIGEPACNDAVIEVLQTLPGRYHAPTLLPSISTIAPAGKERFFERLLAVQEQFYREKFQFQFSLHSTDPNQRRAFIPVKTWSFEEMSLYGERLVRNKQRKVSLNFALATSSVVDAGVIARHFSPRHFLIKITPLNPTHSAARNQLVCAVDCFSRTLPFHPRLIAGLEERGFEVILSVGQSIENEIGSNCGQMVRKHLMSRGVVGEGYQRISSEKEGDDVIRIISARKAEPYEREKYEAGL